MFDLLSILQLQMPCLITMFLSLAFSNAVPKIPVEGLCTGKRGPLENSAEPGFWLLAPLSLPTQQINQAILQDNGQLLVPDFSTLNALIVYVSVAWKEKKNEIFLTLPQLYVSSM